jgi:hypothetical protein
MPDAQENIISLQRFRGLLKSVECTQESISLGFKDGEAFEYAKGTWEWVNQADNHTFVLVAGTGDCGWNTYRVPFIVSNLKFDEKENSALVVAKASKWEEATHTYTLRVGSIPKPSAKFRRQLGSEGNYNPEMSFGFDYKFAIPTQERMYPVKGKNISVTLDCDDCGTHGRFTLSLYMETILSVPTKMQASFRPHGVSARIVPKLTLATNISSNYKLFDKQWPPIPMEAVTIPGGVVDIVPHMSYRASADAGPLTASASLSGGTVMTLDDSANISLDLLGTSGSMLSQKGSFTPDIKARQWILEGKAVGELKMKATGRLGLAAKALGMCDDSMISLVF